MLFGREVRQILWKYKLTPKQLGLLLGVSRSLVYKWTIMPNNKIKMPPHAQEIANMLFYQTIDENTMTMVRLALNADQPKRGWNALTVLMSGYIKDSSFLSFM